MTTPTTSAMEVEELQRQFEADSKAGRPLKLYADDTIKAVKRIEKKWQQYCRLLSLDPRHTLKKARSPRFTNFLRWLLNKSSIKKTSTLATYWRQLSQLYIKWKSLRMRPRIMKEVFVIIGGALTTEYHLDPTESEKGELDVEDLVMLFQYH